MIKDRNPVTEKILNLTLEIICLLTGEDYMVVKKQSEHDTDASSAFESGGLCKTQIPITDYPLNLLTHKMRNANMILERTKELPMPTAEVTVRCEDIAVYLSMEEWEYFQAHKEHYKEVIRKNRQPIRSQDDPSDKYTPKRPPVHPYSQDCTAEDKRIMEDYKVEICRLMNECLYSARNMEPGQWIFPYQCKEEEIPREIGTDEFSNRNTPERRPISPYPQDCTEDDNGITQDYQMEPGDGIFPQQCKEDETPTDIHAGLSCKLEAQRGVYPSPPAVPHHAVNDGSDSPNDQGADLKSEKSPSKSQRRSVMILSNNPTFHEELSVAVSTSVHTETEDSSTHIDCNEGTKTQKSQLNTSIVNFECKESETNCNNELDFMDRKRTHSNQNVTDYSESQACFINQSDAPYQTFQRGKKPLPSADGRKYFAQRPYVCDCGKCFTRLSLLLGHQKIHTRKKPFRCSKCGKCFTTKSYLRTHQNSHTEEKTFNCYECRKCFKSKYLLLKHELFHTGGKSFECSECGKCFTLKRHLIQHQGKHSEIKSFSCVECGKCFKSKYSLQNHQRLHTGEKPFGCSECVKTFTSKAGLLQHQRSHTQEKPFPCHECGKCFRSKYSLQNHQKLHTEEKPFACSECCKTFAIKAYLLQHQRSHTQEKPFACNECGKYFKIKYSLQNHQRLSHSS
ncbi:uncharacterized protein WCC33_000097 [Rhinophrynus dorsalis]